MPLSRFGMGLCSRGMDGISVTRLDVDTDERFSPMRQALGLESMGANLMVLQPRQRGRIHRHREQEELYVVLRGELTVSVEGEETVVRTLEAARVAASARRQLANRGSEPVVVLALGAAGEHVARDGEAFADWSETEPRTPQEVPLPDDLPA